LTTPRSDLQRNRILTNIHTMSSNRCHRVRVPHECGHIIEKYVFCNGGHQNEHYQNRACHYAIRLPPATTETIPQMSGYCTNICRAQSLGWYCCLCPLIDNKRQHVTGIWTGQHFGHNANGVLHLFCGRCSFMAYFLLLKLIFYRINFILFAKFAWSK
jgi:hypothetical protein